ncbi:MAG TPA: YceI family protein [Cyclobacteriaceae bacterium]|nr:YceI family protein [Cyclobacteriaceae bacterium]HMV10600.1 YceI family protein [Cyclobacteriaceae bacterium]HMV89920.1 YceI family protein [Cyclobacteriaceae bacterium]HMX02587.1 YceI family protein [Cyclobacteriaceae bacterium]HMX50914.1 YceI family protein [Cyclobacteriaceae bacterium]
MKKITVLFAMLFVAAGVFAQTTYKVDKAHSKVGFAISHMMISEVEGQFNSFDATIVSAKDDFSDASVEFTADVNTVDTNVERRDSHLKSPDFFDAAKYPAITFKSTSFTKTGDKSYKVVGDLTMHGVTKPVTLEATLTGTATGRGGKKLVGFKVTGTVNRIEFGVGSSNPGQGDEVTVTAKTEFAAQ